MEAVAAIGQLDRSRPDRATRPEADPVAYPNQRTAVVMAPPMGFEPMISAVTGQRPLRAGPRR